MAYLKRFCMGMDAKIEGKYCIIGNHKYYQFSDKGGIVETTATVTDNAKVYDDARVLDNAKVYGNARVYDDAEVYGNARVYDDAEVFDDARVFGNAKIHGNAKVRCLTNVADVELTEGEYCSNSIPIINSNEKAEEVRKDTEKFREIIKKYL